MQAVRLALVGYGAWGGHHARAMASLPEARLAAIVERNPESRQQAAAATPGGQVFADHREMLAGRRSGRRGRRAADAPAPQRGHGRAGRRQAPAHGEALGATIPQCEALVAEAGRRGKLLAVGHEFRLSALWGKVKELIAAGEIGEPLYGLIEFWRNPYRLGLRRLALRHPPRGQLDPRGADPFLRPGPLVLRRPGRAGSGFAQANGLRPDRPELQDNFTAMLQFSGGPLRRRGPDAWPAWEHHQVVKITGTRGALWASWSGAGPHLPAHFWLKLMHGDQLQEVPIAKMTGEVYELVDEIAVFARAIRGRRPPAYRRRRPLVGGHVLEGPGIGRPRNNRSAG